MQADQIAGKWETMAAGFKVRRWRLCPVRWLMLLRRGLWQTEFRKSWASSLNLSPQATGVPSRLRHLPSIADCASSFSAFIERCLADSTTNEDILADWRRAVVGATANPRARSASHSIRLRNSPFKWTTSCRGCSKMSTSGVSTRQPSKAFSGNGPAASSRACCSLV